MIVKELVTKLGFKTDVKSLRRYRETITRVRTSMHNMVRGFVALEAAAAAAGFAIFKLADFTASYGDIIDKTIDRVGLSVRQFQELRGAAELAGVSQENFGVAFQRFNRIIGQAAQGNKAANKLFSDLKISIRDGNKQLKSTKELFEEVATGMSKISDKQKRVSTTFKFFFTTGVGMINLLKGAREGIEANIKEVDKYAFILDKKAIKATVDFTDQLLLTKLIITGLRNRIGLALIPQMKKMLVQFAEWTRSHKKLIKTRINEFVKTLIIILKTGAIVIKSVVQVAEELFEILGRNKIVFGVLIGVIALLLAPISLTTVLIGALVLVFDDLFNFMTGGKSVLGDLAKKFVVVRIILVGVVWAIKAVFFVFKLFWKFIKFEFINPFIKLNEFLEKMIKLKERLLGRDKTRFDVKQIFTQQGRSFAQPTNLISAIAGTQRTVNVNSSISVNVPQGTSMQQKAFLEQSAKDSFNIHFDDRIKGLLTAFPRGEK